MHVNGKKTAVSGLLMAVSVLLIILSGLIEMNTLFLLAAAAFCTGIIIREYDMKTGTAFFAGCLLLGVLLAPQKLYCITFAMMGIYVLGTEGMYRLMGKLPESGRSNVVLWAGKFLIFNVMYLPALFFFPKLLFAGEIPGEFLLLFAAAGQVAMCIYDKAYEYFLIRMWEKFRTKLFGTN